MAATSRFAVAVHALAALGYHARRDDGWMNSERLAESIQTNPVVVRRAIAALGRAGLVEAQTGRGGGARLARTPEQIPLSAVYRAVEGDEATLAHNPNPPHAACAVSCAMRGILTPVFTSVDAAVDDALGRVTLADVLAQVDAAERGERTALAPA